MSKKISCLTVAISVGIVLSGPFALADAQESFYKGKTIRLIVGLSAGSGYDVYSRTIARHMGKHIPGNPVMK